jgi:hydrogenase nickel incorporation protein HypA/HybF
VRYRNLERGEEDDIQDAKYNGRHIGSHCSCIGGAGPEALLANSHDVIGDSAPFVNAVGRVMHELSIAVSMVDRIMEESETRGGLKVEIVHLKVGVLSGVDKDALLFSYEIACESTPLLGSKLVIETVPLLIYCERCAAESSPPSIQHIACERCDTPSHKIIRGREIEVVALEVAA